ncbi:MAG: IS30 family transposase, partial [Bacteroidota bacterium]|nr:IS30 family transposase [Bacteroidota bacterium]
RVGIESRPAIVDEKSRVGNWEVDLIVGNQHKGYLLTLVERKTKLLLMCQLANKQADTVKRAIVRLLKLFKPWVHTITAENGAEFARHEGFAKQLRAAVYFTYPYAPCQRGLSEHTNGLVGNISRKATA